MYAESVSQPVQYIADHSTGGAGNDTNDHWHTRQRPFPLGIKQPFSCQTFAAFLQLFEHRPFTGDFHLLHDDLVF